jgi:roadblock/LC7 domain-containing protein
MTEQAPAAPSSAAPGYPISLDFDGELEVQNWRPLVNWLLAIPHWIILYFLAIASVVLGIVSFFTVLFTRRNPFVGFQSMFLRYEWRVTSYTYWMRNEYPPFDFDTVIADNGLYPATVSVEDPGDMNRWLPLVKWFLAIPHYIVLAFLGVAVWFVLLVSFFMVLFTGKWSVGMRDFVVGVMRWGTRVYGYVFFITDPYPPFTLQP